MARDNEVILKISTESDNGAGIRPLVAQLEALAAQGGASAPELARLADEIKQLDQAAVAAQSLDALDNKSKELAASIGQASARIAELSPHLSAAGAVSGDLGRAQAAAARQVDAAKASVTEASYALKLHQSAMREAGGGTAEMVVQEKDLATAKKSAVDALKTQSAALKEANAALTAAKTEEKALASEISKTQKGLERANIDLAKNAEAHQKAAAAAQVLGVNTASLQGESARLGSALTATAGRVRDYVASLDSADKEARQLAQGVANFRAVVTDAFAVVGVRSAKAIEDEIQQVNHALLVLANRVGTTGPDFDRAFASGQARIESLRQELRGTAPEVQRVGDLAKNASSMLKGLAAAYGGMELARQFIKANVELENNRRALKAVTGDATKAAAEMEFLRGISYRLGIDVNGLTEQYIGLLAATKGTALEGEKIRGVFTSVTNAMGQLGSGSEKTQRALTAISQMASKGTVSMEELRGQLGEALPGAMTAAAKGLGITEQQLEKVISSGGLLAEHFLPALAKGLDATFTEGGKKVEGFQQSWNRMKQSMTDTATFVGDSGFMSALAKSADWAAFAVRGLTTEFIYVGKAIGVHLAFIANFDFKHPIESIKQYRLAMGELENEMAAGLDKNLKLLNDADSAASGAANTAVDAGKKQAEASIGASANADAQTGAATAADKNASAQTASGNATATAGKVATTAATSWTQLSEAAAEALKSAKRYTSQSEKLAEAKKIEGDVTQQLAAMTGNETLARQAAVAAAINNDVALSKVADSKARETSIIQAEITALNAEAAARGGLSKAERGVIDTLQESLDTKKADAEQARQSAQAAKLAAEQARLAAEIYKDNADRLGEYRAAATEAEVALRSLEAAQFAGIATEEQVSEGRRKAAAALALYKDAMDDAVKAAERKLKVMAQESELAQVGFKVGIEEAKTAEKRAEAEGREADATRAKIDQKHVEIDAMRAAMDAKSKEIDLTIATAKEELKNAEATGNLTAEKRAEIEARIRSAEVKRAELGISEQGIKQIEVEIEKLRELRDGKKAVNQETDKTNDMKKGEAFTRTAGSLNFTGILGYLKSAGLDEKTSREIGLKFVDQNGDVPFFGNPGQREYAGNTLTDALGKAVAREMISGHSSRTASSQSSTQTQRSAAQPVVINIGGTSHSMNLASRADVSSLETMLRELAQGAARS